MDSITIATFDEPAKAEPLKQRLEQCQIPAEVHDESVAEHFLFVMHPLAGVKLRVRPQDYENARHLIYAWDQAEGALRDAVRCPECKSSRVDYPQFTRKFILPNLVVLLSAFGFIPKEFFCLDCHCTWPVQGGKPSKARPHMAPNYFLEDMPPRQSQPAGGGVGR
jgi:predicted Zn-ribbon and HTH transcriptional regulator